MWKRNFWDEILQKTINTSIFENIKQGVICSKIERDLLAILDETNIAKGSSKPDDKYDIQDLVKNL